MTSWADRRVRGEGGAYAILYAVLVVVIVGMVSVVLDIGQARLDRRQNRSMADAAAIAGSERLGTNGQNPLGGCREAMLFAKASLGVYTTTTGNCTSVFGSVDPSGYCSSSPPGAVKTAFEDVGTGNNQRRIFVVWPVYDSSQLMTRPDRERWANTNVTQAIASQDGAPCKRMGVLIRQNRNSPFATVFGKSSLFTESRSVGMAGFDDGNGDAAAPLVVLDPSACQALNATGGADTGGVIVTATSPDPVTGKQDPGVIQVDSTGKGGTDPGTNCSGGGGGTPAALVVSNNSRIWALDGTDEIGAIGIQAFSAGGSTYSGTTTNCPPISSTWDGTQAPAPILCRVPTSANAVTDLPWVSRYNCHDLAGQICFNAPASRPPYPSPRDYVDQWQRFAEGAIPPTWTSNPAVAAVGCNFSGSATITGDFYTGCSTLKITGGGSLAVTGHFVAAGNVWVDNGCLVINRSDFTYCSTDMPYVAPAIAGADGKNAYVGGTLQTSNGGSLIVDRAFIFVRGLIDINMATADRIALVAPYGRKLPSVPACLPVAAAATTSTPTSACFEDLALWTPWPGVNTGGSRHSLRGQSHLRVDGTLFAGASAFLYTGQSENHQLRAQFVTRILNVTGGGALYMTPDATRTTPIQRGNGKLIR